VKVVDYLKKTFVNHLKYFRYKLLPKVSLKKKLNYFSYFLTLSLKACYSNIFKRKFVKVLYVRGIKKIVVLLKKLFFFSIHVLYLKQLKVFS